LYNIYDSAKDRLKAGLERQRALEVPLESFSRRLWPWSHSKLVFLIVVLAVLDYVSTYAFLTFGGPDLVEGGRLAAWALQRGSFSGLFLMDALTVGTLIILAFSLRSLYSRLGFRGLGRTAFVFLLMPYFVVVMAVVYNNIIWALV
jgi:hypothetical protein